MKGLMYDLIIEGKYWLKY